MPSKRRIRSPKPLAALAALLALWPAVAGCTDLRLARYRDDRLLAEYRYALGEEVLTVDGLRVVYQERGRGPTLVIIPGLATSVDFWQLNIPALAEHFHVIALDPPGLGKSDKPDRAYDLPWMRDRVLAFLDAKGVERFSVMGGSLGGHLALMLALEHPERVEHVVMMGSTGAWEPPGPLLEIGLRLLWNEWLVVDYMRGNWPHIFGMMFAHRTKLTERILRVQMAMRADGARYAPEGRAAARALKSIFYNSCRARLGELKPPLLLIWGEGDRIHPPDDAYFIRRKVRQSRLVIVPDAGHEVMMDQTEEFNRVVIDFLTRGVDGVADRFVSPG